VQYNGTMVTSNRGAGALRYYGHVSRKKTEHMVAVVNTVTMETCYHDNMFETEEQEDYVTTQLLADIGGQLGLWVGVSVITLAELVELLLDFVHYVGRKHGPYARGREFSRACSVDRSAYVSGSTQRPTPSCHVVCNCGARYCEAAERRVSLSLTSRRRRCTSCCDCSCARSRAGVTSLSHVGDLYDSVLPRSTT